MLILLGRSAWRGVLLGSLAMALTLKAPLYTLLGLSLANTLESFVNISVLGEKKKPEDTFRSFLGILRFITHGIFPGVTLSATVGTAAFYLAGSLPLSAFMEAWWGWWISAALSTLVLTPLIVAWSRPGDELGGIQRSHRPELLLHILFLMTVSFFAFFDKVSNRNLGESLEYLLFISLAYFSVRWGLRVASLATLLVTGLGITGTSLGKGMFTLESFNENLVLVQLFVGAIAFVGLVLSASVSERDLALGEAQKAIKVRDEFLQIASHELNTPLTSLKMQAQFLNDLVKKGKIQEYSKENLERLTQTSERQISRFVVLVKDLLDVSKLSAGRLPLRPEKGVDLSALIHAVVDRYQMEIKSSKCALSLDLEPQIIGCWDSSRIDQVIANLLSNSLKYGSQGAIQVQTRKDGATVRLVVRDQGIGIDPKDHERIFERFERGSSPADYGGLGLGLYISREIVQAHGGEIGVESEPGKGSVFFVNLPIQESQHAPVGSSGVT